MHVVVFILVPVGSVQIAVILVGVLCFNHTTLAAYKGHLALSENPRLTEFYLESQYGDKWCLATGRALESQFLSTSYLIF